MNSKSRELIHMMLKLQDKLSLMYKNVSVIDGQYDVNLQSASKILSELMKKRTDYYRTILIEAADESEEISDQGYTTLKEIITTIKGELSQKNFTKVDDFIQYAIGHTTRSLEIVKLAKKRMEEIGTTDQPLFHVLSQVENMEAETVVVLSSFVRSSERAK